MKWVEAVLWKEFYRRDGFETYPYSYFSDMQLKQDL